MSVLKRACPDDFEATFIAIGRLACEEHYRAGQDTITRWLTETGKGRLIEARKEHVRTKRRGLSAKDMGKVLKLAFPVSTRSVSDAQARHAAQHLRKVRNGGWIVSPAGAGLWWVGSRRRTAAELVELAIAKGFDPATLSRSSDVG